MDSIKIRTLFGGDVYLWNHLQIGWSVEIYIPRDSLTYSERRLLVPPKYFRSKSGAMNFIKRMIAKYASIMGEIST
jgi:hypothetical protein